MASFIDVIYFNLKGVYIFGLQNGIVRVYDCVQCSVLRYLQQITYYSIVKKTNFQYWKYGGWRGKSIGDADILSSGLDDLTVRIGQCRGAAVAADSR